jgi:RHS repeat-associated protein
MAWGGPRPSNRQLTLHVLCGTVHRCLRGRPPGQVGATRVCRRGGPSYARNPSRNFLFLRHPERYNRGIMISATINARPCWGGAGCTLPRVHWRGKTRLRGSTSRMVLPPGRSVLELRDRIGPRATPTPKCIGSVYRARYYDPIRSRFVQEDPIGSMGGDTDHLYVDIVRSLLATNLYRYASNSPVNMTDPLGLFDYSRTAGGPLDRRTEGALRCVESCLGREVVITGARESGHSAGSAHETGQACDLSKRANPNLRRADVEACFRDCTGPNGFLWGQEESGPPHYHMQTRPGSGGATGFAPGIR